MLIFDLHRHLGGSISAETVWKILQVNQQLDIANSVEDIRKQMTFGPDEPFNFHAFLNKFGILNRLRWTEEAINIVVEQVVRDLKHEGVDYAEIRFTINKYLSHLSWNEREACLFVIDRFRHWCVEYQMPIGLILALNYGAPKTEQKRFAKLIDYWQIAEHLVGIDIVGDETHFDANFYEPIFRYWRLSGKGVVIHVGESLDEKRSAIHVREAITRLRVNRIAHGIKCYADKDILSLAIDNDVAFDVALTSNQKTAAVKSLREHPIISMFEAGCKITIGTDDPTMLETNISKEYEILSTLLPGAEDEIKQNSVDYSLSKYGPSWMTEML